MANDLIWRDSVIEKLQAKFPDEGWDRYMDGISDAADIVAEEPAVDAAPIRCAYWISRDPNNPECRNYYCSHCKAEITKIKVLYYRFCSECGSAMNRNQQKSPETERRQHHHESGERKVTRYAKTVNTSWTTIIKEYLIAEYSDDVYGRRRGIHKINLLHLNGVERPLFRKEFDRLEAELIGKTAPEIAAILKQWQQEIATEEV